MGKLYAPIVTVKEKKIVAHVRQFFFQTADKRLKQLGRHSIPIELILFQFSTL
jgi:hypothetical protein